MPENAIIASEFVRWIGQITHKRGWDIAKLAHEANVAHTTISRACKPGYRFVPKPTTLRKISDASGFPIPSILLDGAAQDLHKADSKEKRSTDPRLRVPPDSSEGTPSTWTTLTIADDGALTIPAALSSGLKLEPGAKLLVHVADRTLMIEPIDAAIRRAQAMVRRYIPLGAGLVDELIAERHAIAERE